MGAQSAVHAIAGDEPLVFMFFETFSRFECALKRGGFVRRGQHGSANPDWGRFADEVATGLDAGTNPDFIRAKSFLLLEPPRRQVFVEPDSVEWEDNPRRQNEAEAQYLLRLVRDVRNNLFHGGKYPSGSESEVGRNAKLLRACLTVLDHCRSLNPAVGNAFRLQG
jgi:hypothetical protein